MRRKTKAKRVLDYENEEQDEKEEQKLDEIYVRYLMETFWVFFVPLFCLFVAVTWNIVSNERVIRMTRAACPTARAAETEETNGCCQTATWGEFRSSSTSSRGAPEVGHEGLGFFLLIIIVFILNCETITRRRRKTEFSTFAAWVVW